MESSLDSCSSLNHDSSVESRVRDALECGGVVETWARAAFPGALGVYVFGSRAQGAEHAESDLDLAILVEGYVDPSRLWDLSALLAERVGCEVDLLDLRAASTVMQYQILTKGRRLWGKDPDASLFESFVCSEKMALDEARSALLADIAKEGRVHGR